MGVLNMKIEIYDEKNGKLIFDGVYEFVEGGIEKDGRPSFHIDSHSENFSELYSVYFYCKDKEEVKEFIKDLQDQVLK